MKESIELFGHRDDFPAIPSKIYIGLNCKEEYRKELVEVAKSIDGMQSISNGI